LFYSLRTNIPGLEAIEVVEGMNAVRRRAFGRTTTSRIRRFFTKRNSILSGVATLLVVFGLLFASAPTAQAYSTAVWSEFISTGGGGGIARADCKVGESGGAIYAFETERSWALTNFRAACTTLNSAGTGIGGWERTLGPYGQDRNGNTYQVGRCDFEPDYNKVVVGATVYKDSGGFVIGLQVKCGTLPSGSYYSTQPVIGLTSGNSENINCPANEVAVGLYVAYGNILDKFGLRCGPVTGATQSSISVTSTSGTFGSTLALSTSGGSGSGAVTYQVTSAGTAGCSVSGSNLSATAAGTCTVTATKATNVNYAAASSSATTITFNKANQTITFANPGTKERSTTPFAVAPTASSGQPVSISSSTTSVCTTSVLNITMVTTGTCTIVASQAGNDNYNAATNVSNSFTVQDTIAPTITAFSSSTSDGLYGVGGAISISATTSEAIQSGNSITVTLETGTVDRTVVLTAASAGTTLTGTYTVQSGDVSADLTALSYSIGTVRDTAGNAMTSTTMPASASNIAQNSALVVDGVVPTMNITATATTVASGGTSTITFTSTEATTNFANADVSSTLGTLSTISGSGTTYTATFTASPSAGGTAVISVASGSFSDAAGNNAASVTPLQISVTNTAGSSGGRTTYVGDGTNGVNGTRYFVQRFTTTGSSTWTVPNGVTSVDVLVVGGGGGAGHNSGGGGSGGGVSSQTGVAVSGTVNVTVGAGGAAGTSNGSGVNGGSSSFGSVSVSGGNRGTGFTAGAGGASVSGSGAGGQGSSGSGVAGTRGSDGPLSSITGTSTNYAGGGGGGGWILTSAGGSGGAGGGGAGGGSAGAAGIAGTANTGGGGGSSSQSGSASGAGGSGIVVVRYALPDVSLPDLHATDDLGGSSTDDLTSATTLTFTGSAPAGSTVQLFVDGVASGSTCAADATTGAWSCDTGVLTAGERSVTAQATTVLTEGRFTSTSSGLTITIDTTLPTVTTFSSSTADGTYGVGATISIAATTSEAIRSGNSLTVTLETGSVDRTVSLTAGAAGASLTGTYTVQSGDVTSDLSVLSFTIVSVSDTAGNAMTSTTVPSGASNIAGVKAIVIDGVVPTMTVSANPISVNSGGTSTVTFTASEATSTFELADISATLGTLSNFQTVSSTSYTATFTASPSVGGAAAVSVALGSFTDAAGNASAAVTPFEITVNNTSASSGGRVAALSSGTNYIVERFTTVGTSSWVVPQGVTSVEYLVIAGGGGGAGGHGTAHGGGGGGAGGYRTATLSGLSAGTSYTVTVGAGGSGGTGRNIGARGNNSVFGSITSSGGGGGGAYYIAPTLGGSGGGAGASTDNITGASGTAGQGFAGGNTPTQDFTTNGAGGGGSGGAGTNGVNNGAIAAGGIGTASSITGTSVTRAAGGAGGLGTTSAAGASGSDNSGNGGGGGSAVAGVEGAGGAGGSGIVIIRYAVPSVSTPDLDVSDDLGSSSTDNITTATTLTFTGSAPVGSTVQLQVDGVNSGSTCTANSTTGVWSCDTGVLTAGDKVVTAVSTTVLTDSTVTSTSSGLTVTIDTTVPTVSSIVASSSTLKSGQASTLTITLSESSTNFIVDDITVSGGTLSTFAGSGSSYTVVFTPTANTQSGSGSVSIASGAFTDSAGNTNTASSATSITYDTQVPTVSNVTSSSTNGTFSIGDSVSIQVTFTEAVTVSGAPRLTLETGSTDRAVDYVSGSGTSTLTFTYTVQAGDSSTDLDYVSTSSLALNGGSIVDAATNTATLTLPTPGASGSLGANKAIVVTSSPTKVVSVRTPVGTASGAAFSTQPRVSLQDLGSNVVVSDSSTVVTATVSAGASLVGTRTATAVNGVATFDNLGITGTAGTAYTITYSATFGGNALTVATQSVTPTVGAATQISITTQPVGATAGALLANQPVVKVLDSGSNVVTGSSASISVSASGGTLGGSSSVSASSGVATFTDLTFAGTANTNYTLTFASTGFTSQTSNDFSVGVGAATKLVLTTSAATAKYGQAFTTQPVVQVQDAGSNVVTSSSAMVTASLSSGTVVGTGNATSSSGVATFSGLGITGSPASYTVTYSSGSLVTASQSITVTRADQDALSIASTSGTYGAALTLATSGGSGTGATTYAVVDGTATGCAESGGLLTVTTAGTCTVTATKALDSNYNSVSSSATTVTFAKAVQASLTLTSTTGTYGATTTLAFNGGSGTGSISYSVSGTGCSISAGVLSRTTAGDCSVTVTKATDTNYEDASSLATTVTFAQASNTVTFASLADRLWSASTFTVAPTATSGDTPTVASTTTNVCTVSSLTVTMVSSGTCSLTASEDGNGNYLAATNVVRTFEIARVTPSAATWTDVTVTYSAAAQSVSPPAVSFGGSSIDGAWTYVSSDTTVVSLASSTMTFGNFGTATVTGSFTPTDTGKYNSISATMNVSVDKIRPLFTWANVSKTYGDAPFSLTAPTVTNSVAGTWAYSSANASVATLSSATATVVGAGTSTITATFTPTDTTNYVSGGTVAMTFTVSQVTPLFSWSNVSATYGDANRSITAPTVTNSIAGSWSYVSATTSVASVSGSEFDFGNAGTSTVTATFTPTDTTNYVSGGTVAMTVTVAQATPTFTWSNVAKTYGDSAFSLVAPTVAGSIAGSWSYASATTSVVSLSGSTASVNAAGSALVTATFTPTDTANYVSGGTVTMTVSVATADQSGLTITSVSGTYGSTVSLAVSGGTTSGSVSYATTGAGCSITSGVLSKLSAGDCSVTATMAGNDNYNAVSSLATTVTFAKASQSGLSVTTTSGTYGIDLTLNVSGGTTAGLVTYVVTGAGCSQTDGVLTKNAAGDCSVTATMAGNDNYNAVSSSATTVTFARVALTVTADAKTKEYGESDPLFTRTITSGSLVGSDTLSGSLTRESGEDVNTYAINQGTLANSNYDITFVPANLTITQRPITVTATATTKQYGATDPTFDYSVTTGSLVSGGALTGALGRESGANVGSYAMTIGTLANSNYNITFVPANFTITQRPITVTAAAKSKEYGASDPVFTHTVTTGSLVVGDALTGSLSRVTGENIGTYAMLRGTVENTNYDITYVGALLTVTQRPITVTADAVTKEFGAADPALTYSITTGSLVVGDALTGSLSRALGETVGTYLIAQDTLTNSNYAITYVPANLSVTQRAITVTAATKSKEYGATDPELTYSVTTGSLVPTHALSGSLSRATGEDAGTYAISQGTLANSNYNITYVGADLSITQRPITVSAASATKQYGASDPTFAHSVTNGSLIGSDTLTGSLSRVTGEDVGSHEMTIGTLANANYNITFNPANLTITQRPVTVTAADKTKVFGSTDPPLTYSVTSGSLVGLDSFSGGISRVSGEDVDTYVIGRGTLANSNYDISFVNGTMSITRATQGALTVTTSQVVYGTSVVLGSAGGSGTGDVSYAVTSAGTAECSISSSTLTATGDVGSTCTVTATKAQSTNYNAASSSATTIIVIDRAITVTATAVSKTYGEADPEFAYTITSGSLVDGDELDGALDRIAGEDIGTREINQGTLANANYVITFVSADLTIDARPITVTATNKAKTFGDDDPSLAYTITSGSLVGTDAFTGDISRNSGENIGSYVIGQGTLAHSNYAITFNDGSFVINGANQSGFTLSAADTLVTYQESTTLSVSGGNGNGAVSFEVTDGTGGCSISGNTVTAVAAGTCVITATKAQEGNYNEATSNIVTITVARRAQIVAFTKPADRNFSTTAFTLAPSVDSGLTPVLTSQTANVCTVSGLNVTMRDSGNCTLVASSNSTNNYAAATDVTQTFEITAVVPYAPILDSLTASDGAISASFTLGSSGGSALLNHEYSLDNGTTWSPWPNGSITSPLNISNLENGVEYQVKIRAVNAIGAGAESNMLAVTPLAPVIVVAAPVQTEESTTTVVSSTTTVFVVTTVTRDPAGDGTTTTVARRAVTTTVASRNGQRATSTTTVITTTTTGSTTTTSPATSVERRPAVVERATSTTVKTQTSIFQSFTPTVPAANVPDTIPARLSPTDVASVVAGRSVQVVITQVDKQQVHAAIGESTMMVASVGETGALEPLLANGSIAFTRGSTLRVDGTGMMPGSQVAVWLHSTPTKLGSANVGADGTFAEVLSVPANIELGGHKVQFIGSAPDGSTMEFALGVTVVDDTVLIMNKAGAMTAAQANSLADANVVSVGTLSSDDAAKLMLWFLVILILVAGLIATKPQRIGVVATRVQRFEMATPWLNGFAVPRLLMVLVGILAGFGAANSTMFDASSPSALWIAIIVVLGVLDVVAGSVAGGIFVCSVLASGSVQSISDIRLMAIVVLLGMLPSCISRVVRPSSRVHSVSVAVSVVMHAVVVVALLNLVTPLTGMQFSVTQSIAEIAWMAALGVIGRELLLKVTHTNEEQRATQLPALRLIGVVALSLLVFGSPVTSIWTVSAWVVLMAVVVVGLRIRVGLRAPSSERVFITSIAAGFLLVAISTGAFIPDSQTEQITGATSVLPIGDLKVIGELDVLIDGYPRTFVAIKTGEGEVTFINGAIGQSLTIDSYTQDGERIPLSETNQLQLVRGHGITINANGYAKNQPMNAWVFSDPVLLGNATTNNDGAVRSKFQVPNVPVDGPHTLQIRLVAVDGKTVSFSIPIMLISQVPNGAA
jgi:hypothetical protein